MQQRVGYRVVLYYHFGHGHCRALGRIGLSHIAARTLLAVVLPCAVVLSVGQSQSVAGRTHGKHYQQKPINHPFYTHIKVNDEEWPAIRKAGSATRANNTKPFFAF